MNLTLSALTALLRPGLKRFRSYRNRYTPLVEVAIFKKHLLHNLEIYRVASQLPVAPVLKSNAYGHGLLEVAGVLAGAPVPAPFMVVDSYHEALILRNEGVVTPLLIIGFSANENIVRNRLKNVAFTISSMEQLRALAPTLARPTSFHIKIDTGMHRQGIHPKELDEALALTCQTKDEDGRQMLRLEGLCSHLADGENDDAEYTRKQIMLWNSLVTSTKEKQKASPSSFPQLAFFHLSATSGLFHAGTIQANVMRLGLGLYGIPTSAPRDARLGLKPVLEMTSLISSTKKVPRGALLGYNGTFEAPKDMTIATIPAGYNEGIDRRLSNEGTVKVAQFVCRIVGRVSMNITTIDISHLPAHLMKIGTPVTLISADSRDTNSILQMADRANASPYELLVHIPEGLRRVVRG
ncbi:MAG: alanine racemase [bacterium]